MKEGRNEVKEAQEIKRDRNKGMKEGMKEKRNKGMKEGMKKVKEAQEIKKAGMKEESQERLGMKKGIKE